MGEGLAVAHKVQVDVVAIGTAVAAAHRASDARRSGIRGGRDWTSCKGMGRSKERISISWLQGSKGRGKSKYLMDIKASRRVS